MLGRVLKDGNLYEVVQCGVGRGLLVFLVCLDVQVVVFQFGVVLRGLRPVRFFVLFHVYCLPKKLRQKVINDFWLVQFLFN